MTDETNYNDGKWHGWNGEDRPVHPKSEIECLSGVLMGKRNVHVMLAGDLIWDCIVAFRVIKEYREPREWWAVGNHMCTTKNEAEKRLAQLREDHPELGFDKWEVFCVVEKLP